ncbi:MAG TPA: hypothetical protein DCL76_03255 [Chloroflexi bacterium]|nr:hypothetical protein [Chloroflexota bacterium]
MNTELNALLRSWEWRFDVVLIVAIMCYVYVCGFIRISSLSNARNLSTKKDSWLYWRLISYLIGLLCIVVALVSPLEVLAGQLFFMHMIQHMLLVMFAAPLLLIANPFPVFLWGLPVMLRRKVSRLFVTDSQFRKLLAKITSPGVTWIIFVVIYIGWHDPGLYDLALTYSVVHDIEHISFFVASLLFWWHVTAAAPRIHHTLKYSRRVVYLLVTVPVNMIAGVFITFSREPIYQHYVDVQRPWSLTVMQDQMIGGIIMWIPGSMMLIIGVIVLVIRMMNSEEGSINRI